MRKKKLKDGSASRTRESESSGSTFYFLPSTFYFASASPVRKRFGQHFLIDEGYVRRIIAALAPQSSETIIEIGSGRGALTRHLVKHDVILRAIEIDRDLGRELEASHGAMPNFSLVVDDALRTDFCSLIAPAASARVIANLPYNISTPILTRLIEYRGCVTESVLMLQREVVERITARAGDSERGYLSVFVEAYCDAQPLFDVPPTAFNPPPKVWSSVVRLRAVKRDVMSGVDEKLLWRIVSAGFAQRRKTIFNNLRAVSGGLSHTIERCGGINLLLEQAGISPRARAETLTLDDWTDLTKAVTGSN
ncbi:MAG: 16S rRNA (adenine(1518)-N(6)/adenine(1519)-N(6))-dimethyltransferase RsmA [Pyrinomonadaceae bacterium MAG19_C2-C3]|nr:16S rRNA (adenine(1518)-N(6)/adenine(1519)-N(6))-dimethyltransferase RsmA [Pyrinomonadaceae bacterium MAG19_C2-C3]